MHYMNLVYVSNGFYTIYGKALFHNEAKHRMNDE